MTTWPANSYEVDVDVECRRCGDPYRKHEPGGGACKARDGGRCPCLGYLHPAVAQRIRQLRAQREALQWRR